MERRKQGWGQEEGDFEVSRLDRSGVEVDSKVRYLKRRTQEGEQVWKDDAEFI